MLESVFGTSGCLRDLVVSGMTDLQIVEEALRGEGITREHIYLRKDELRRCYLEEMKRAVATGAHVIEPIPGGREVLQAVAEHPRYASALLTGNIEPAAHFKVEAAGLAEFFTLPGAFGDESFDRRDLPASAARRINKHLGAELTARTVHRDWRYAERHRLCPALRRASNRRRDGSNSFGGRSARERARCAVAELTGCRFGNENVSKTLRRRVSSETESLR